MVPGHCDDIVISLGFQRQKSTLAFVKIISHPHSLTKMYVNVQVHLGQSEALLSSKTLYGHIEQKMLIPWRALPQSSGRRDPNHLSVMIFSPTILGYREKVHVQD